MIQPTMDLDEFELRRYRRQIIIPSIGEEGQKKLKNAAVFIAGVGGLGSISAFYLAAAGVGRLVIVDKDSVDLGNLNRQIIHTTYDLGKKKVESAKEKLERLNPYVKIETVSTEINEDNVLSLIGDCQIIVDAMDNIEGRRIMNKAAYSKRIPYVFGGVEGFNGMVTVFVPGETACFECIFPRNPEKKEEIGVIGPSPGIIASIQAMETIKFILGLGGTLKNRLLFFSGLEMSFHEIRIERNPKCAVCGKNE
ncbi:MAG: HesA/MoeB/ThiF family protein [Desulfobacterota bacterium]|nr:HesA/MoeB/ThiF family protein [Thermodesulfobacteriota bacterium]MDW8002148.1 HesA/MoeB/ThiF family protein [Deltaproteobacteria bacterium]